MPAQSTKSEIVLSAAAAEMHDVKSALDPASGAALDLTVFVSCYNERDFIVNTLKTLRAALAELGRFSYEVIVIDDRSSDDSVALIKQYIAEHPQDRILLRANGVNLGWAQNYLDAAFMGRGKYYRVICGDNSEPKETMVTVFNSIGEADILIPYYATSEGRSAYRLIVSGIYTWLVNLLSGFRLHYYNGLPLHLRYNVMRWHSNTRGFGFQADILCLLAIRKNRSAPTYKCYVLLKIG